MLPYYLVVVQITGRVMHLTVAGVHFQGYGEGIVNGELHRRLQDANRGRDVTRQILYLRRHGSMVNTVIFT